MRISDWSSDVCSSDLGGTEHRHPVFLEQPDALGRIEAAVEEHHGSALAPRAEQDAGSGLAPTGVGGAPGHVVGPEALPVPRRNLPGPQGPRGVQHALRAAGRAGGVIHRSEEHKDELQSLMRLSYAVFCLQKKTHYK